MGRTEGKEGERGSRMRCVRKKRATWADMCKRCKGGWAPRFAYAKKREKVGKEREMWTVMALVCKGSGSRGRVFESSGGKEEKGDGIIIS